MAKSEKPYVGSWKRHGEPAIKTEKNKSGHTSTSKNVMIEGRAKIGWDSKGQVTSRVTVPGYKMAKGTPGYVQSAANAAERLTKAGALDCGYGTQDVHKSHRQDGWTGGKPEVKKDAGYKNPQKESS